MLGAIQVREQNYMDHIIVLVINRFLYIMLAPKYHNYRDSTSCGNSLIKNPLEMRIVFLIRIRHGNQCQEVFIRPWQPMSGGLHQTMATNVRRCSLDHGNQCQEVFIRPWQPMSGGLHQTMATNVRRSSSDMATNVRRSSLDHGNQCQEIFIRPWQPMSGGLH